MSDRRPPRRGRHVAGRGELGGSGELARRGGLGGSDELSRRGGLSGRDELGGSDELARRDELGGRDGRRGDIGAGAVEHGGKQRASDGRAMLRSLPRRQRVSVHGGVTLGLLVLACNDDDTIAVDLSSGALVRLRVPWPEAHAPDLAAFDVVEATLADDPERDDLAHPEAVATNGLPRQVGTLHGRRVYRLLKQLAAPADGPLLGFVGPAAPYWEFRGARPSTALIVPSRGPQLIRRTADQSTWVRFGWDRDDVWLPVEDPHAARSLDAARQERLSGKPLATALGFAPKYLLASLSRPRNGHCYKVCAAVLPSR